MLKRSISLMRMSLLCDEICNFVLRLSMEFPQKTINQFISTRIASSQIQLDDV